MKINLNENDYYYCNGKIMYVAEHLALLNELKEMKNELKEEKDIKLERDKYIKTLEGLILKHALKSVDKK